MTSVESRTCPRPRWHHADTWLEDFAIITWAVDPDRMRPLLAPGFEPHIWDDSAWVSMVAFNDVDFHFRFAPFIKMGCGQVNYRAYVGRAGDDDSDTTTGVWFVRTALDSRLVVIAEQLWKMPWVRTPLDIKGRWNTEAGEDATVEWSLTSSTPEGDTRIKLTGTHDRLAPPPGLGSKMAGAVVLFDPFDGWYHRRRWQGCRPLHRLARAAGAL